MFKREWINWRSTDKVGFFRCLFKVERQVIRRMVAEIKMNVPGDDFMVKKQCKTFEGY
jgi:putative sigma-54 modulation protein